jgi:hypothetical protein
MRKLSKLQKDVLIGYLGGTLFVIASFGAVLSIGGCQHKVNSANPQVVFAATLLDAATACDSVADGLTAANSTIGKLETTEPEYYTHARALLVKVAKANDAAIIAVRAAKAGDATVNWQGAMAAIAGSLGSEDLTVFGFKNPQSANEVKIGLASFQLAISAISGAFGKGAA